MATRTTRDEASDPTTTPERLAALAAQNLDLRRRVAENPSAPPEVLAELAKDSRVMSSVARNPNTPPAVMFSLAVACPVEVLENPSFALFLLSDGPREIPRDALLALLARPELPLPLAEFAAKHEHAVVRAKAASLPLPPMMLQSLLVDLGPIVRRAAAKNPNTPAEALALLARLGAPPNFDDPQTLLPAAPEEDLYAAAALGHYGKVLVGWNEGAPPQLLHEIVQSTARQATARNPRLSVPAMRELVARGWGNIARYLFLNPALPAELIEEYLQHNARDDHGLVALAEHPNASTRALDDIFARTRQSRPLHSRLYVALAKHPRTSRAVLQTLATVSQQKQVLEAIALRPSTPAEVLCALTNRGAHQAHQSLAAHPNTPAALLRRLAGHQWPSVRATVAARPDAPPEALQRACLDPVAENRQLVASNPAARLGALRVLLYDRDAETARRAAAAIRARGLDPAHIPPLTGGRYSRLQRPHPRTEPPVI